MFRSMFEKLRDANENVSALAFLAMSFAALYLIAGLVHPELFGLGDTNDAPDAAAAPAPNKDGKAPPAKTVPASPTSGARPNN